MLEYLRIRDLALIQDAELEFSDGINVLTGETGAGKSFVVKALDFLMGDKLQRDMVRPGADRALVEALFSLPDQELVLRRELSAESGRSRFYMNDALCSQELAQELRSRLLFHTTQHGRQKLLQPGFQAALVDAALGQPELLAARDALLQEWRKNAAQKEGFNTRMRDLNDKRALLMMQQQEIDKVMPLAGEEEALETRRAEAREQVGLATDYENALHLLYGEEKGIGTQLHSLERILERLAGRDEQFARPLAAVQELSVQLPGLETQLRRVPAALSPKELDALEARLYTLAQLKRKLRRSLDEILSLREDIEKNLSFLDSCTLDVKQLALRDEALRIQLSGVLRELSAARRTAGENFARRLEQELIGLGFSENLQVCVEYSPVELVPASTHPACMDERARLLWAPNPGIKPQALDRIASGGELSRFLLALTSVQAEEEHATLIFDEVDAGIGGLTLTRLAERLEALALKRQMLLITHWPQIAARAKRHFLVSKEIRKEETFTLCARLDSESVKKELGRMSGGDAQAEHFAAGLLASRAAKQ